jgi:hypothetical protein
VSEELNNQQPQDQTAVDPEKIREQQLPQGVEIPDDALYLLAGAL